MNHISDLIPDSRNPRLHPERNIRAVVKSLEEVGFSRSIVIDENNVILAGNGVVDGAGIAGIENVQIVDADGDTIVAVRRSNLSEKQKKRLAVLDNRASELAEWDAEVLKDLLESDIPLDDLWYDNELAILTGTVQFPDDPRELWEGMPEFSHEDQRPFRSIHVHFACESDVQDFAKRIAQTFTDEAKYIWHPKLVRQDFMANKDDCES